MKWITRARPKTDRIACPWLITKFIDPEAEILYVPVGQVLAAAAREDAISFDAPGDTRRRSGRTHDLVIVTLRPMCPWSWPSVPFGPCASRRRAVMLAGTSWMR